MMHLSFCLREGDTGKPWDIQESKNGKSPALRTCASVNYPVLKQFMSMILIAWD